MQEDAGSLTLSSPLPVTSVTASTWRLPAINAGTLATSEPDCGADLDQPLHDMPPPDEGVKPPTNHLSEQI
jgi:hypothetical protein